MKKLPIAAAVAALGMSAQAFGYNAQANLTFEWATDGIRKGWTSSAPNSLGELTNATIFNAQAGNNSTTYYNADFATADYLTGVSCPPGFEAQYACKTAPGTFPIADEGPGAQATGSVSVTATTMTGTLTVVNTNDEGAGLQPGTSAATGYNVRSADGSPFKNVWYGVSDQMTLTLNLTGTFSATSWEITGGTVGFADPAFQCAVADFSGVLCNPSTTGGGFQSDGSMLSWGMDQGDGAGTGVTEIQVFDAIGTTLLETLSGIVASITISGDGSVGSSISGTGDVRTGSGSAGGGCLTSIRYNGSGISCGTLSSTNLIVSGTIVPVPAAAWLFGSALGLLGWVRRRVAA